MPGITRPLQLIMASADRRQASFLRQGSVRAPQPSFILTRTLYGLIVKTQRSVPEGRLSNRFAKAKGKTASYQWPVSYVFFLENGRETHFPKKN